VLVAGYSGDRPRGGAVGEQNLVADAEETVPLAFASGAVAAGALEINGPTPTNSPARL
jgi:hypothetical protein